MIEFPKDFLWGAAASSYQVEGNNSNCDWWEWEKKVNKPLSGNACSHYQLYQQDFDLAKSLNHNAHRLSIEWSRVEKSRGEFCEQEIQHYKDVILALKQRGIEPVVTLHHFTNPLWFSALGGWKSRNAVKYFLPFVEKIVDALSRDVRFWITINEPMVYIYHSYILGTWPPQETSLFSAKSVQDNMAEAHIKAYRIIHNIYQRNELPAPLVSISQNLQAFVACAPTIRNKIAVMLREWIYNYSFINKLVRNKSLDFIGVNYYGWNLSHVRGWGIMSLFSDTCKTDHHHLKKNSMGWDIYPQGLGDLLRKLKKYNLPVMITENGICTADDNLRWEFINSHLEEVGRAIQQGVNVIGYLYWSLLDNFEWDKGFVPRFGIIEVNYENSQRTVRESAKKFAEVCKTGVLL